MKEQIPGIYINNVANPVTKEDNETKLVLAKTLEATAKAILELASKLADANVSTVLIKDVNITMNNRPESNSVGFKVNLPEDEKKNNNE